MASPLPRNFSTIVQRLPRRLVLERTHIAPTKRIATPYMVKQFTTNIKVAKASPVLDRTADSKYQISPAALLPKEFDINGRVYAITGASQGRGLGLTLAEYLAKRGAQIYCLDQRQAPAAFYETKERIHDNGVGSIAYVEIDVANSQRVDEVFRWIADSHGGMHGLVAAAAIQHVEKALKYPSEEITRMMDINFKGVYLCAQACANQMIAHDIPGSMVFIGSMSGKNANKGLYSSVYNASKAAVNQLGKNFAMELAEQARSVNHKPIRVNVLNPGNIITPMVLENFKHEPHLKELWESNNMLGRLSQPEEFNGAVHFMLSDASSFMTASEITIDGGYTAW